MNHHAFYLDFEKNEDYEVCALIKSIVDDNLTRTQAFEKYGKEKPFLPAAGECVLFFENFIQNFQKNKTT